MKPIRAGTLCLTALAFLALPQAAGAGQKIFFGDIDFGEEITDTYQPTKSVRDFQAADNEDGGPVSIKVEGPGAGYTLRLLKRGCEITSPPADCPGQAEALSPGIGLPTVLTVPALADLSNTRDSGSWYEIEAERTLGTATTFTTTVSPLQSSAVTIAPGTCLPGSLIPGETDTYQFVLTAADLGVTGEIDVWFDDIGISPGSNTVELFDATNVVSKGVLTKSADVSLDNSEIDTLKLTSAGTYRVNVRKSDPTGQGDYEVCVGPKPDAVCPALTLGVAQAGNFSEGKGDRDCYTLSLAVGTELLRFALTETGTTPGNNEVRVERISPAVPLDVSLTAATSFSKTVAVGSTGPETYRVTVNNLLNGQPTYTLTATAEGACLGTGCLLVPDGSVKIPITPTASAWRQIQTGVGAASFQIDPSGSGTWTFQVRDANHVVIPGCNIVGAGSANFYLENCYVGSGAQPAEVQVYGPSAGSVVVSMGPDLSEAATPCTALDSGDFGLPIGEVLGSVPALSSGGDEDCYEFQAGFNEQMGLDYDVLQISDTKTACVYHYDGLHDWRRDPTAIAEFCYSGTADGTTAGSVLVAGEDYQVVIDTNKWDFGTYDFCLGPEANNDTFEAGTITLAANQLEESETGRLDACGDADVWTVLNDAPTARNLVIEVEENENSSIVGSIYAATSSSSKKDATRVTLAATSVAANGSLSVTIDHDKFGFGNYVVRVKAVP